MKIPAQQNGNPLAACYCSQLEKALSEVNYAKPLKRQFLSQMQDSLCNYLEAHPDARLEDLYAAFGTPQEAADSALLNTDSAQIKKQLKTSQLFHFLFAVVIAILVMVVVYRLGALAINRYVSQPYIIESPHWHQKAAAQKHQAVLRRGRCGNAAAEHLLVHAFAVRVLF